MPKLLNKYLIFSKLSAKNALKTKETILGFAVFLSILLLVYNKLWNTIIINNEIKYITLPNINFVWYLFFTELIILSTPALYRSLEEDINFCSMAYFINRPVNFFIMRFAEGIGTLSVTFAFLLFCGISITYLLAATTLMSHLQFMVIIVLCFVSTIVTSLLMALIGFCALWFHTTKPIYLLMQKMIFVLGGAVLPLIIYPGWLINIAKYTPFYYMFFMVAKLSYAFNWHDVILVLMMELFWGSIFIVLIILAYRQLYKRINIYGG